MYDTQYWTMYVCQGISTPVIWCIHSTGGISQQLKAEWQN